MTAAMTPDAANRLHAVYQLPPEERWQPGKSQSDTLSGATRRSPVTRQTRSGSPTAAVPIPWKALTALTLVVVAGLLGIQSLWAAVLIWWVVGDIRRGTTWFMESVDRSAQPGTYWLLLTCWLVFSGVLIMTDFQLMGTPA